MMKNYLTGLTSLLALSGFMLVSAAAYSQCNTPTGLGFTALGPTSVDLTWTSGGATNWNIEYGPAGFTQGSGTMINATSTTININTLAPNVNYDFYVRDSCGVSSLSAWAGPDAMAGMTVPCDNFDTYGLGLIGPQSSLINEWAGAGGDAAISLDYSNSAPTSLKIYDSGPGTFSDVVAEVGTYTSGIHNMQVDFFVPQTYGGYYNILHNYVGTGTNVWAIEVYLDSNGTATVNGGTNSTTVIGTYNFNVGAWNTVEHIIDLDNDTAFILVNGAFTTVGWQFSLGSTNFGDQFNAMNFYSAANVGQTPLAYFDNFCVTPAPIDDIGALLIDAIPPICGDSSYGVPVWIRNNAMNNQSNFNVEVQVSGSSTGTYSIAYPGTLTPGQIDTLEIGNVNTQAGGTWNFTAFTDLVGDMDPSNDTVSVVNIAFLPGVSAEFGPEDTTYCDNENFSILLDATNTGATYAWSNGTSGSSITANAPGTYAVTVTASNGCTAMDEIELIELPAAIVDLGPDENICAGEIFGFFLNAGNTGSSFDWSTGDTTQIVEANTLGQYIVSVENSIGCITTDTINFTEVPVPVVVVDDQEICGGETAILDAGNPGALYDWSTPGEFSQTLTVTQSGTYSVTVIDANGCSSADSATVTVNVLPFVILGSDTTIVVGQTLTLDAGFAGSTYIWSTAETSQTIDVTQAGTYSVTVTDGNGCDGTDEIEVDVKVGIQDLVVGSISIYPNPVEDVAIVQLQSRSVHELRIEVYAVTGRKVIDIKNSLVAGTNQLPIEMTALNSGMYYVRVFLNDTEYGVYRIVKM